MSVPFIFAENLAERVSSGLLEFFSFSFYNI